MSKIKKEKAQAIEKKPKKEKRQKIKRDKSLFDSFLFFVAQLKSKLDRSAPVKKVVSEQREIIKARAGTDTGYANYALKLRLLRIILCYIISIYSYYEFSVKSHNNLSKCLLLDHHSFI